MTIRVLLADDHTLLRAGIRLLLESQPDLEIIGESEDGQDAVNKTLELKPDIVLMDIAMPGMNGLEATREIKRLRPETHVLTLTMHENEEYFFQVLNAGASGYVLKRAAPTELVAAIRSVSEGGAFLYPTVARKLVDDYLQRVQGGEEKASYDGLTDREREVLRLIADGLSNQEIAESLCLSTKTVERHRSNIMEKLDIHNRTGLIKYAIRKGLIDIED